MDSGSSSVASESAMVVVEFRYPDAEALAQKTTRGIVPGSFTKSARFTSFGCTSGSSADKTVGNSTGVPEAAPRTGQRCRVEAERLVRREVSIVERLQRMPCQHPVHSVRTYRRTEYVEKATEGDRRWSGLHRDRIGTGIQQNQMLARRHHGIEKQLPVFTAQIALPHNGIT